MEVGSGGDQGQDIEVSVGHAHQLQGLGLGRTLQKIVGGIVGRRLELGANTVQGSGRRAEAGRDSPLRGAIRGSGRRWSTKLDDRQNHLWMWLPVGLTNIRYCTIIARCLRAPVPMVARLEASPWAEVNVVAKLHRDLMSGSGLAGQHV